MVPAYVAENARAQIGCPFNLGSVRSRYYSSTAILQRLVSSLGSLTSDKKNHSIKLLDESLDTSLPCTRAKVLPLKYKRSRKALFLFWGYFSLLQG